MQEWEAAPPPAVLVLLASSAQLQRHSLVANDFKLALLDQVGKAVLRALHCSTYD